MALLSKQASLLKWSTINFPSKYKNNINRQGIYVLFIINFKKNALFQNLHFRVWYCICVLSRIKITVKNNTKRMNVMQNGADLQK